MTDTTGLDAKALEAGAEAVLALWKKQGLENCSSLEMSEVAIRAYLSASPAREQVTEAMPLDDSSLRAKIGALGNELHNVATEHQNDEELTTCLGSIVSRLWDLAALASPFPTGGEARADWQRGILVKDVPESEKPYHGLTPPKAHLAPLMDEVEAVLSDACDQILDSYRTWVADDCEAHPRPGQIPRYDRAHALLTKLQEGGR